MTQVTNRRIQRYIATYHENDAVTLDVDMDVLTPELATEINNFWGGGDLRRNFQNGDVVQTVVRMFAARLIFWIGVEGGTAIHEVPGAGRLAEEWCRKLLDSEAEGWPAYEELGIRLVSANVEVADYYEVSLEAA